MIEHSSLILDKLLPLSIEKHLPSGYYSRNREFLSQKCWLCGRAITL